MALSDNALRSRIKTALIDALQREPDVLAGWESGSAAFDLDDAYSDIDLNFLLAEGIHEDDFYRTVKTALYAVSPVVASHAQPPGQYYKLADGSDFLLVDVCVYRIDELADRLHPGRHGRLLPLFDKGNWLQPDASADASVASAMAARLHDHQEWFVISQSFVRKAIARSREVEALTAYWGYTLRPLVDLLRMRYCPVRWDFGMRYLETDLPRAVYDRLRPLVFVASFDELDGCFREATAWGEQLLRELESAGVGRPRS